MLLDGSCILNKIPHRISGKDRKMFKKAFPPPFEFGQKREQVGCFSLELTKAGRGSLEEATTDTLFGGLVQD